MPALGAALIGMNPKENPSARFGRGALPIPKGVDEQITSRFSPAVSSQTALAAKGPYSVQGRKASDLESRCYRMLLRLGWTDRCIQFQVSILGGRRPGGQVLDYVLYGPGPVYVIQVNGDYWHAGGVKGDETRRKEAAIINEMPSARVLSLFTADLLTDEIAYSTLSRLVGRGM